MLEIFHVETPIFFSFTPPYTPWGRLGARARLAELISGRGERTDVRRIFSNHRAREGVKKKRMETRAFETEVRKA